jgi:hypothetical protein
VAQVAFMIRRSLNSQEANTRLTAISKELAKDGSYDAVDRINLTKTAVENGKAITQFERIKVEVNTLADVVAVQNRRDFVRFCCGGHRDIYSLIASRKADGRSDWYA